MDQKEQRRRLGANDFDTEQELLDEATTTVVEGSKRLDRKWPELVFSGFFGGVDVGLGILAMVLVTQATGSDILAGMAFGIGLLALKLAHSELFTEEFLLPQNAVIAGQGTWTQVVRLWSVTLVTNLLGGPAFAWLTVLGLPDHHATIIDFAVSYLDQPSLLVTVALSMLAGTTITLSTRMQQGTASDVGTAASGAHPPHHLGRPHRPLCSSSQDNQPTHTVPRRGQGSCSSSVQCRLMPHIQVTPSSSYSRMRWAIMRSSSCVGTRCPYGSFTEPSPVAHSRSSWANASRVLGVNVTFAWCLCAL